MSHEPAEYSMEATPQKPSENGQPGSLRSSDLFGLLRTMLNKHHAMAADDYREGVSDRLVKKHYDEYMAAENAFTAQLRQVVDALKEIDREASGALNNAFPDEAPDVLANVAGIARRALGPNSKDEPGPAAPGSNP